MKALRQRSETQSDKAAKKLNSRVERKNSLTLWLLALPGFLFMVVFSYLPMGGIVIAFKDYAPRKGIFGSPWCGFDNFKFFFTSQDAVRTIGNTLFYSISFLILDMLLGISIALLLYHLSNKVRLKIYHSILLIPRFLSIVVISYIVYAFLNPMFGLVNQWIVGTGGQPVQWYSSPQYWRTILTSVHLWQIAGSGCLYYYAALVGIDETLLEAASIDGASAWQKCWHIMIPSLIPVICILTILGIGQVFTGDLGLFYQVTRDQGPLYPTTDVINTYTYRALLNGNLEKSTAVGLFQSLAGMILVLITNGIIRKVSPDNSMF